MMLTTPASLWQGVPASWGIRMHDRKSLKDVLFEAAVDRMKARSVEDAKARAVEMGRKGA